MIKKKSSRRKIMAIFHLEVKKISRRKGRSCIAAGAYIMGKKFNELDAENNVIKTFNYKRKDGIVARGFLYNKLFNDVEDFLNKLNLRENRKNSCTAREIVINLPHELNEEQRKNLTQDFCRFLYKTYNVGVVYAIHKPTKRHIEKGGDYRNHHAHILITTRELNPNSDYKLGKKLRIFDDLKTGKETIKNIRTAYEKLQNLYLERAGLDIKVSAKSYKEQGIDKIPTKHIGVKATNLERSINAELKKQGLEPNYKSRKRKKLEAERTIKELEILEKKIAQENQIISYNNQQIKEIESELNNYIVSTQNEQQNLLIKQNHQLKTEILNIENQIKTINQQKLEFKQSLIKRKDLITSFTKNIQITQQNLQQIQNNISFINKNKSAFTYKLIQIFNKLFNKNLFNNIKKILSKNNNIKNFLYQNIHIWFLHYKKTIQKNLHENLQLKANLATSIIQKIKPEFYFDNKFNKDFSDYKIPQPKFF